MALRKSQPATKIRTCKACGAEFEYPIKGSKATRFHCDPCVQIPVLLRTTFERMQSRLQKLEKAVEKLKIS